MIKSTRHTAMAATALAYILLLSSNGLADTRPPASPAPSVWDITSKTSAMDGKTTYVAGLPSSNQLTNSAGVDKPVRLVVRCRPETGLEVYVAWPLYMGSSPDASSYRMDDQPVIKEVWTPGQGGTTLFLPEDVRAFLGRLSLAKRLVVQAAPYQQMPSEAVFDLGGVADVAASALKACP